MSLTTNLVSFWPLDQSSGTRADAHGANDLEEFEGGVGSTTGVVSNAADFNGTARLRRASGSGIMVGSGDWSLSFWTKFTGTATKFLMGTFAGATTSWYSRTSNGRVSLNVFGADFPGVGTTGTPNDGNWHHYVFTRSGSTLSLYVDGALDNTATTTGFSLSDLTFYVGGAGTGADITAPVDELGVWDRALSGTEAAQLYNSGSGLAYPFSGGGASYTLTAATGSFTLTGPAAGLAAGRVLTAGTGSLTLTGRAAGLTAARTIVGGSGSFALTGRSAGLAAGRLLTAARGSFALTGQAVTLTYTPAGSYTLTAGTGSFALTGRAAGLTAARTLAASPGAYTLTGRAAGLYRGYTLVGGAGVYGLTGGAAGLTAGRVLTAARGTYALVGRAVSLVYSGGVVQVTALRGSPGVRARLSGSPGVSARLTGTPGVAP